MMKNNKEVLALKIDSIHNWYFTNFKLFYLDTNLEMNEVEKYKKTIKNVAKWYIQKEEANNYQINDLLEMLYNDVPDSKLYLNINGLTGSFQIDTDATMSVKIKDGIIIKAHRENFLADKYIYFDINKLNGLTLEAAKEFLLKVGSKELYKLDHLIIKNKNYSLLKNKTLEAVFYQILLDSTTYFEYQKALYFSEQFEINKEPDSLINPSNEAVKKKIIKIKFNESKENLHE